MSRYSRRSLGGAEIPHVVSHDWIHGISIGKLTAAELTNGNEGYSGLAKGTSSPPPKRPQ